MGAVVRLSYDGDLLRPGDGLRTRTGRLYLALSVRVQVKGAHAGRQHLRCMVAKEAPAGARVLPLFWYRR